jgi:hypothetical protein
MSPLLRFSIQRVRMKDFHEPVVVPVTHGYADKHALFEERAQSDRGSVC